MFIIRKEKYYLFFFPTKIYPLNNRKKLVSDYIIKKGLRIFSNERTLILNNIKIIREDNKKPFIKDRLFFNLSHCKNYYCLAVSENEIGVDIEAERVVKNYQMISKKIFGKDIAKENFLQEWTKWEAKIKLYDKNIFDKEVASLTSKFDVYKFLKYTICVCQNG